MASESVDADIRAEIPALLSIKQQQQNKLLSEPQCQQRWGWRDDQRPKLSPNEVAEFVRTYAWPKETELALQCLFEGDYDVPQAVEILHKARREKLRLKREETERIHNITFERAMDRHGKKFHLVKRRLDRNVTTRELVSKFYLWKITPEYEKWHDGQREKKRKREAKRLARLHPAADQHREYCEVCLKGGKLLCCDGCERAYHLNCVRPALFDIPEGDWFCSHCRDAAPKTSPAKKRYNVSVPGPDTSKSTSKPKTKANGASLKGGSDLQPASHVRDIKKKIGEKYLVTEKSPAKIEQATSSKPDDAPDHFSTEDLDGISDITTESESDGGAAKVFQSLTSNYGVTTPSKKRKQKYPKIETNVGRPRYAHSLEYRSSPEVVPPQLETTKPLKKRKQKYAKIETIVGRPRYTSPSHSLEYGSSSVKAARGEVVPLQFETTSSSRKRMRRFGASRNIPQFPIVNEAHTAF